MSLRTIGRVAAEGKAGAYDASDSKGCARSNESIPIFSEAWTVAWWKSLNKTFK